MSNVVALKARSSRAPTQAPPLARALAQFMEAATRLDVATIAAVGSITDDVVLRIKSGRLKAMLARLHLSCCRALAEQDPE